MIFINSGGLRSGLVSQYDASEGGSVRFLLPLEIGAAGMPPPIPIIEQFSFAPLLAHGFTVFDARHPSVPDASLETIVDSIRLVRSFICDQAERFGIDGNRVDLWGCSSGGYLALLEAMSNQRGVRSCPGVAYYPGGYDVVTEARKSQK